ncbi:FCD domain-containing protein [Pseudonocardia hierapolitana]|uniref:FCD domain-containing protein n=1 Tax=Pseudonocardia hierapolitana TaxID=1128676 RepID=UPI0011BD8469
MSRTARRLPDAPEETSEEWAAAHGGFHGKLIEACGVPVMLDMCSALVDATELYRRWSAPRGRRVRP